MGSEMCIRDSTHTHTHTHTATNNHNKHTVPNTTTTEQQTILELQTPQRTKHTKTRHGQHRSTNTHHANHNTKTQKHRKQEKTHRNKLAPIYTESVSDLVFYAQSTSPVISGRHREQQTTNKQTVLNTAQ